MTLPVWVGNLIAYSLQIGILAAAGTLLVNLFRLRLSRATLIYWQILLLSCLLLPFLQRWKHPVFNATMSGDAGGVHVNPAISGIAAQISAMLTAQIPWEVLGLILAAGILARLAWLLIGLFRLRHFRHKSYGYLEEHDWARDLHRRTGVRAQLLISLEIDTPVAFGLRSPTIILPESFGDLSEPCRRTVLCHELLHVRRYDWIFIIAEEIVRSLFWFHPAVWWLLNRIHLSREQVVDYEVVQLIGSKQPYLDSLLEFAQAKGRPKAVPAPLFLKERHLVLRVASLIKEASMSRSRLAASIIGITVLLMGTVYLAVERFPLTGAPVFAQEPNDDFEIKAPRREPIHIGQNVAESKLIRRVEPIYPEQALRARVQGLVVLVVTINEEGFVYEAKVASGGSSPAAAGEDSLDPIG